MPSNTSVSYFTHTGKLVRLEALRMHQELPVSKTSKVTGAMNVL